MLVVVKSMAEIHDQIKEIETDLRKIIAKFDSIENYAMEGCCGIKPRKAIASFANGLRGLQGWHLGELKNAFGMGVMEGLKK